MKNVLQFETSPWWVFFLHNSEKFWSPTIHSSELFHRFRITIIQSLIGHGILSCCRQYSAVYLDGEAHVMMGLASPILNLVSEQKCVTFSSVLLRERSQNTIWISLLLPTLVLKVTHVVGWGKEIKEA